MPRIPHDPTTDDGLKAACEIAISDIDRDDIANLAEFLATVAKTTDADRADRSFQRRAWSSDLVFDGGLMSETKLDTLLSDDFCRWFAGETAHVRRRDEGQRTPALKRLFEEVLLRAKSALDFKPHVETLRTLALFFPESFTDLANKGKLKQLADTMGLDVAGDDPVQANRLILGRLESVLGAPEKGFGGLAKRMLTGFELFWLLCTEPHLWAVRAGREGQDEEYVLANGIAMLGFEDEPAPDTDDNKAFVAVVQKRHPDWAKGKAKMTADQIWNFAWEIQKRDIVVLPRKRGDIAWGTVEGEYKHREVNGAPRHTHPVNWVRTDIPRDDFGDDEKYLNQPTTVFPLQKHAERILPVLKGTPVKLTPLPLSERRILLLFQQRDEFGWLRWMLGLIGDEIDPDVLHDLIAEKQPGLARTTTDWKVAAATVLRCVAREGGRIKITDLGRRVCESDDADVLMDRLLTGIRGADHALLWLDKRPRPKNDLVNDLRSELKMRKPAAVDLVKFLQNVEVIEAADAEDLSLTERGARWRRKIHWVPELPDPRPSPRPAPLPPMSDLWDAMSRRAGEANLRFERSLLEALHLGLWADEQRHFAVLSGLSGTGKTQIALRYAMALTGAESDTGGPVEVIAVHPGWHDPGPLLGYVNPLTGGYARTEFLNFLLEAATKPDETHVLILDEMNLSHPEQYFAPILSAMEISDGEIPLHRGDPDELGVPTGVAYPKNLVLIGTVNMDETTMGISDKVLDRAFTLEFWDIEPEEWPGWESCGLDGSEERKVRGLLAALTKTLSPARRHFGWRVISEVVGFLEGRSRDAGIEIGPDAALDQVIYAKVLPKLRGSDTPRFRKCLDETAAVLEKAGLEMCARKVRSLKEDLDATGSCSFWR